MSLSSEKMMKLMAYADGELEGAQRTEAELLVATDIDSMRFIEQIAELGDLVKVDHAARTADTIAAFDVSDLVMAQALSKDAKDAAKSVEPARVTSLASARQARESRNNFKIGAGIAAALALAASVFVFAQHRREETPMAHAPAPAGQPAATGAPGTGVAVESAGNSVSVFYLPTANELSTSVVVWVDEPGEK